MMKYRMLIILPFFLFLMSCSIFSPVKSPDENQYVLNTQVYPCVKKPDRRISLFVAPVRSDAIYNSTNMAYSNLPYKIDYFSKSQWAEPPPQMLQSLIMQTLQHSHYFYVVDSSAVGQYNYLLSTQLIELQQVFYRRTSEIHLKLHAELLNAITNKVIATKTFTVIQPARPTPYGGVIAANRATGIILDELVQFCVTKI